MNLEKGSLNLLFLKEWRWWGVQGEGTEQDKDGGNERDILDVFGVEMQPKSRFSMLSFSSPGRSIAKSLWFPFPWHSLEGDLGSRSREGKVSPWQSPTSHKRRAKSLQMAQAKSQLLIGSLEPQNAKIASKREHPGGEKAQRTMGLIRNVNSNKIPFSFKVLPKSFNEQRHWDMDWKHCFHAPWLSK